MKQIIDNVNFNKFPLVFKKYVATSSSYLLYSGLENGSICGFINGNKFQMWQNIGIRNVKMLTHGVVCGEISEDGTLVYYFRKRMDGVIFLIGMSIFGMIVGALMYHSSDNFFLVFPFALLALLNIFIAFYHSKKDKEQLKSTLDCIIYEVLKG